MLILLTYEDSPHKVLCIRDGKGSVYNHHQKRSNDRYQVYGTPQRYAELLEMFLISLYSG